MTKIAVVDKNNQARENIVAILKGFEKFEVVDYDDFINIQEDFDLVIFDVDSATLNEKISKIKELKIKNNNLNFIALSYEMSSILVSTVLKEGIDDFLIKPIIPNVLEASIKKLEKKDTPKAKTISVFSNKGGVGKTSLATNLAYEICKNIIKRFHKLFNQMYVYVHTCLCLLPCIYV